MLDEACPPEPLAADILVGGQCKSLTSATLESVRIDVKTSFAGRSNEAGEVGILLRGSPQTTADPGAGDASSGIPVAETSVGSFRSPYQQSSDNLADASSALRRPFVDDFEVVPELDFMDKNVVLGAKHLKPSTNGALPLPPQELVLPLVRSAPLVHNIADPDDVDGGSEPHSPEGMWLDPASIPVIRGDAELTDDTIGYSDAAPAEAPQPSRGRRPRVSSRSTPLGKRTTSQGSTPRKREAADLPP